MIRDEIKKALREDENKRQKIFEGLSIDEKTKNDLITTLMSGHHLLILGPPGCGKTKLAQNLYHLLSPREVVKDCPIRCAFYSPSCPWCQGREKGTLEKETLLPHQRLVRLQGNPELKPQDIIGDIDPEAGLKFGLMDLKAFVPGKLLKANGCILLIDFIEQVPERTLNTVLQVLDGDSVQLGRVDKRLPLDMLIVGTGSMDSLKRLSADLLDHFDIVKLSYPQGLQEKRKVLEANVLPSSLEPVEAFTEKMLKLVKRIREHDDVERGVSPRATIHCLHLFDTFPYVNSRQETNDEDFYEAVMLSFPHRLRLKRSALSTVDPFQLVSSFVKGEKDPTAFQEEEVRERLNLGDLSEISREIAEKDLLRVPLMYGFTDILLKRLKNMPESQLAKLHSAIMEGMIEKHLQREKEEWALDREALKVRHGHDMEVLKEIEEARLKREKWEKEFKDYKDYFKDLEKEALDKALEILSELQILKKDREGWILHKRGVRRLLDNLLPPEFGRRTRLSSEGKHPTHLRLFSPMRDRVQYVRRYKQGDRYKDFAIKETIKEAIKQKHREVQREDFRVYEHGRTTRLDIIMAIDCSGTMVQGDKFWYAKEAAGALASASSVYCDRVGLVIFSNMATKLLDPVDNPVLVMEKMVNLSIHKKAFTNIGQALKISREICLTQKKSTTTPHIIIISDGHATAPYTDPNGYAIKEAVLTKSKGITISTVCLVQGSSDIELMRKVCKIGGGRLFLVEDIASLPDVMLEEQKALKG